MNDRQTRLAQIIFELGFVRFDLKKGFEIGIHREKAELGQPLPPLSPVLVDLKQLDRFDGASQLAKEALRESEMVGGLLADVSKHELDLRNRDVIACVSTGMEITALMLAGSLRTTSITVEETSARQSLSDKQLELWRRFTGRTALVVGGVLASGASKLRGVRLLEQAGMKAQNIAVLLDREQGGAKRLEQMGYTVHSVLKLSEILVYYYDKRMISQATYDHVLAYLKANQLL